MANESARKGGREGGAYRLEVPLDASAVGDLGPDEHQDLKVVVRSQSGTTFSSSVALDKGRRASAHFDFRDSPGPVTVFVGPATATDDELLQSQTIVVHVGPTAWAERREVVLEPVKIATYWWFWWLRWCREYVIRGRVVCPDGSPVPGAEVCAFDVDWWFFWSSTQQVGCATTDITGAFEIRFRWCCGWWPWWWWLNRVWQLDEVLLQRVGAVLETRPDLEIGTIGHRPSLAPLQALLKDEGVSAMSLESADAGALESLRSRLVAKLPASADLAHLRVWPWVPWWPWWDCSPDIIFRARQQCGGTELTTIVDESISNTRWDIPTRLDVTLVAKESACCLPGTCEEPPCPGGECLVVDKVCEIPLAQVGGNVGAPAAPAGYALPGSVAPGTQAYDGDRPFGGNLSISKNPGDLVGVDYLELEMLAGMSWVPLPMGAELAFSREYLVFPSTTIFPNFPAQTLSGHRVWETREHFQAASGAAWWPAAGASRAWLSYNYSLLGYLDTSKFSDGTYRFRAVGWNDGGGGTLVNRRVIPICGSEKDNEFVLTFDNRVVTHVGHNPAHNCGTVHTCTLEPDTHILDVRINGASVLPCDTVGAAGSLEIDFEVTDPDAHLAVYSLIATWGLNSSKSLLPMGTITALTSGAFTGPTYGEALGQGATAPLWSGGRYRLTVADAAKVFEEPCCYQLELRAWKRTIVNCYGGYSHDNLTEYSLGVGIC